MDAPISTLSSLIGRLRRAHRDPLRLDVEEDVRNLIYGWRMGTVEPATPVQPRRANAAGTRGEPIAASDDADRGRETLV